MTRQPTVLAVAAPGHAGDAVRSVAKAFAGAQHAALDERLASPPLLARGSGAARRAVVQAARAEHVTGIVVDAPTGDPAIAMRLAAAIAQPVVFVPRATRLPFALGRVLIPLDGSRQAIEAVAEAARIVRDTGADVIVLHCLHGGAVPLFEDHPQYEAGDWAREFTARFSGAFGEATLEVREGPPAEHAVDVCESVAADLIVLGWSRRPAPTRARTVRAILRRSAVPVMLLPTQAHSREGQAT